MNTIALFPKLAQIVTLVMASMASATGQTNGTIATDSSVAAHKTFGGVSERIFTNTIAVGFVSGNGGKSGAAGPVALVTNYAEAEFDGGDFFFTVEDGLFCADMKLIELKPADWSDLEAKQLAADLAAAGSDAAHPKFHPHTKSRHLYAFQVYHDTVPLRCWDGNRPVTCGFQSRHGVMGILQITRLADNLAGVRIRYKLVQVAVAGG
jgi:hypothetical protein